jgi:tRNA-dihydrouridine synthase B
MMEHYGDRAGVNLAKKHIGWYSSGIEGSSEFRNKINRMDNVQDIKDGIRGFWGL